MKPPLFEVLLTYSAKYYGHILPFSENPPLNR